MPYQTLQVSVNGALATITLDRPDVRNAFNETMIADLTQAFDSLGSNDAVRAIVLEANGPAFCAARTSPASRTSPPRMTIT